MRLSATNCLHCGKKLSFFLRFRDSLYCNDAHHDAHSEEINQRALSRLSAAEKSPSEIRWEQCERRMNVEELTADFAQQH